MVTIRFTRGIFLVLATGWLVVGPAARAELQTRAGHVPGVVARLTPVERVEGERRLNLAIGLPLRDRDVLSDFLRQLYDPASPNYRQFLTAEQFAKRFGPSEADYEILKEFARSNHFTVVGTHSNRLLLDVNAAAGDIERAFHLKLHTYQHPTEKRRFYAPDRDPLVEARIPMLSIAGLDDFYLPRPVDFRARFVSGARGKLADGRTWGLASAANARPALDASGSGPAGNFLGRDFRNAYVPGVTLDGAGQSVGLVALDNYYAQDITEYEDVAGLPRVPLTNIAVNGFNRAPGLNNGEVALDIEMVISMAPGLSNVLVYEGTIGNDILNRMATDNLARQLSSSWSFGNPVDAAREQIFQEFAAQGQSFFQASGDGGAYGPLFPPADDPWVTAVGGTSLTVSTPGGRWLGETAWFGSGGGVSPNYPIPVWQQSISMSANLGSLSKRNVPDVAAEADGNTWVIANNGEQGTVGGTSAATPLWAGFAALVNQQAVMLGQSPPGFLNPALYVIGRSPEYASAFHDVSAGNNTNSASPTRFFAVTGYDLCTGWGSPGGSNLIQALLVPPDPLRIISPSSISLIGKVGGPFAPSTQTLFLTNSASNSLSWALGVTPAWLSLSPSTGTLAAGGPAAAMTLSASGGAASLGAGRYSTDIWLTNLTDGFAQRRECTLYVVTAPLLLTQPASQVVPSGAAVQFQVTTASNAWLHFQWQSNGIALVDRVNVVGAQTPVLSLAEVTAANAGGYSVVISNVAGVITSAVANLTVTSSLPLIVSQPGSQIVLPGSNVNLSVVAYGDRPVSYQWQRAGTNLVNRGNLSGSTSSTLTISEVSAADAGIYSVIVSNSLGSIASTGASLQLLALTTPELLQTTVHSFAGGVDGAHPSALSLGRNGVLYGATRTGGANDSGTLFSLVNGSLQTLYSFSGLTDGESPNGDLVERGDGTWVGTTFGGGTNGFGTLFRWSSNNIVTTLFALDHTNGVIPMAGLTAAPDGSFFGTAYEGGIFHYGTIFHLDNAGVFSVELPFNSTNGAFPACKLLLAADGKFYGTTYKGGAFGKGTVFSITGTGTISTLISFDGTNGAFPVASLTQVADGSFYGSTTAGGVLGMGNIFRLGADGSITNLFSFSGQADGSHPRSTLLLSSDGNLYGTTSDGGRFGFGTVFRLAPGGGLTTIAQFDRFNGAYPEASLIEARNGSLYGTTLNGGPADAGVIVQFSVPSSKPQITEQPGSSTVYAGGTAQFEVASVGTPVLSYQWQHNGTNLTDNSAVSGSAARVLRLPNVTTTSAGTYSVVISNRYGMIASSPANLSVLVSPPFVSVQPTNQVVGPGATVAFQAVVLGNLPLSYQWQRNGTNLIDLGNLSGSGSSTLVLNNVTEADDGRYTLAVTNALGWVQTTNALLTVVPASAPGTVLHTVYAFTGKGDGGQASELVEGGDGFLYGTTLSGGSSGAGSVFKVGANGNFATVFSFNRTNGASPLCGLTVGSNNVLYGTTSAGGANGSGTVFDLGVTGQLATLYDFNGASDGGAPAASLAVGVDGNLYGGSTAGGLNGHGTLYRASPAGQLTALYSFSTGVDAGLSGGLLAAREGDFFGLTTAGGSLTNGSVFHWDPALGLTTIYSFSGGADGGMPVGSLVRGDDGAFYGATRVNSIRGLPFYGTLFRVTAGGALTTLYPLNFTDGSYPAAGLLHASDGNFYGTTELGGPNDYGTVFRMTPDGQVSTLVEFDGFNDGANPVTALTEGSDGGIYGTTSAAGPGGAGTIFRLGFTGEPQLTSQPRNESGTTGGSAWFSVSVSGAWPLSYQWQKNGTNLADSFRIQGTTSRVLMLSNLSFSDAGSYSVIVTNSLGSAQSLSAVLTVLPGPPLLAAVLQSNGNLVLTWSTMTNRTYQLQATTTFNPANWSAVGSPMIAAGQSLSTSLTGPPGAQMFYRVVLLP